VDFLIQRVERWLWPDDGPTPHRAPRWRKLARYSLALLRDFLRGDLSLRAMSLVYTTMLAVVPLLAFSFAVLKGLGFHRELRPMLERLFAPLGPRAGEVADSVIGFVDNVSGSAIASVSIVLLLFSALSMAQKVESSFNFVWRVDRPRSFARRFSEYLSVMFVGPLVMSVAMGFTATLESNAAKTRLQEFQPLGSWLVTLSGLFPYLLVIAAFSFLYVFVPNTRVRLKPALIGGVFAGVLWAGSGSLFTEFVVGATRTEAIYSGFAIVIVAMFWMYLSWLILLIGAQLAFYVQNPEYLKVGYRAHVMSSALRERLALGAMLLVGRDFETPGHGWRVEGLAARMRVPLQWLEPILDSLREAVLLAETGDGYLVPGRDPRRIMLAEIVATIRDSDRDRAAAVADDWSRTINAVTAELDDALRGALGERSLASLVAAEDAAAAAHVEPSGATPPLEDGTRG
jgi:membrane protein